MLRDAGEVLVGGEEAAAAVHDDPWPLEPVDLARVPDDVQEKVTEIDEQLVAVCTRLSLEPEHITIARRLLVRVAERDPQALRRRGAIGGWVAGLIVVVGDMNRLIGQRHGQVTKKAIAEAAGVKSVGDKGAVLLMVLPWRELLWEMLEIDRTLFSMLVSH